jgi:hypothetical protein
MNTRTSLLGGGVMMLLIGIAIGVYGYYVEPTAGQAIGNIFSGNFTDKRNAFMFVGLIVAAAGGAGVLVGVLTGTRGLRT